MSDATAATATDTTTDDTTSTTDTTSTDTSTETVEERLAKAEADAEKWKGLSKKNEDRAKQNADAAKELEKLRREGMSELEAAVDKAKADARVEVLTEVGGKRVEELVRALAGDRVADVDALLEHLDGTKFLDGDLEPDRDAIVKWLDRIAPKPEETTEETTTGNPFLDLGQGSRGNGGDALNGDPLLAGIKSKLGIG